MYKILRLHPLKLGFFLTLGTSFAILLSSNQHLSTLATKNWFLEPRLITSLSLLLLSFLFFINARRTQWLMGYGLIAAAIVCLVYLHQTPSRAYVVLCLLFLSAYLLPGIVMNEVMRPITFRHNLLQSVLVMTSFNWFLVHPFHITSDSFAQACLVFSSWLCLLLGFVDRFYSQHLRKPGTLWLILGIFGIGIMPWLESQSYLLTASQWSLCGPIAAFMGYGLRISLRQKLQSWIENLFFHPEGVVITFFIWFCLIGSALLALPASSSSTEGITFIDAAFTAVSAVCVTGLNVLDTGKDFSVFGQVVILLLIQIGGLGIMTLSSLALFIMGERLSVQQEKALAGVFGQKKIKTEMRQTLIRVLLLTFLCEGIGGLILSYSFWDQSTTLGSALWKGFFSAISAFCNAGFALESTNFIPWQTNPLVLHVVALLIILGGLSPAFLMALPRLGRDGPISIQHKLIIVANILLLGLGTLFIMGFEWSGSLQHLSILDKLHNAWFQSATTRTAGFNSVDMVSLGKPTIYIMMILMFIGGSPGGTAGGIKTTTFMILLYTIVNIIRGRSEVIIMKRHLKHTTVFRAITITLMGFLAGGFGFICLIASQHLDSEKLLFEVISAVGTVGLSLGVTPSLDGFGKFVIMSCMFLGRVGALSIFLFMLEQPTQRRWSLPSEDVVVS